MSRKRTRSAWTDGGFGARRSRVTSTLLEGPQDSSLRPPATTSCSVNNLQGNADGTGAIFANLTGANTLVGKGQIVVDNGSFECDADGMLDPNIITGGGKVLSGVNLGGIVSDAAVSSGGVGDQLK
ncbi:MAG: hypothetical protein GTN62_03170 [Gemmatimonadales bacterium]|nr:hypothetical protein [Gemmatimonadales bacterium]NIN49101.1 hypothetical protein [Gemmatimonadales bacterium]NIP06565.1 hypothetical protein [Gemmatimonadales bacterium]NIR00262.1 hypothetical protein [Gemmatimonadales bacterium]NIS64595.1 hypothetical protein [Gemmatimonadales bacterium]